MKQVLYIQFMKWNDNFTYLTVISFYINYYTIRFCNLPYGVY